MRQRSGECGETFRPRSRANSLGGVGDWLARLADRLGSEKFRTQGDYVGIRSQAGYSHCRFFPPYQLSFAGILFGIMTGVLFVLCSFDAT